jgi:hypothetical protein
MSTSQQSYNKAIITETPASTGNQEVFFDTKQFNDFIYAHGYVCYIERRLYCPCINLNTGLAFTDCLNCGGTGKFYIDRQQSVIACVHMSNRNKYESWSAVNMGVVNITAQPKDKMGFEDRVTLPELEMWFSEVLALRMSDDGTEIFAFTKYFPNQIFEAYRFTTPSVPLTVVPPNLMTVTNNKLVFDFTTFNPLFPCNVTLRYVTNPQYMIIDINRDMVKTVAPACSVPASIGTKANAPLNYVGKLVHILADAPNRNGLGLFDNTNYNVNPPNYDI